MGFFKALKENKAQRQKDLSRQRATQFLAEKARMEEQQKWDAEMRLYEQMNKDKVFLQEDRKYWKTLEDIEEKYSILVNMNGFNSPAAEKLLNICYKQIDRAKLLAPKWKLYNRGAGRINAYQRIAMIYEKQGRYQEASEACLIAILDGQKNDGTKSGMLGRMTRMLKKGKLEPTEEMKAVLVEEFQSEEEVRICSKCRKENDIDAKFCIACGSKL